MFKANIKMEMPYDNHPPILPYDKITKNISVYRLHDLCIVVDGKRKQLVFRDTRLKVKVTRKYICQESGCLVEYFGASLIKLFLSRSFYGELFLALLAKPVELMRYPGVHRLSIHPKSEDASHIRVVELEHDLTGSLGLSIAGGMGSSIGDTSVIIANMSPAGPAAKSQKLKIGDKILSINDVELEGMSHDDVVQLLKKPGTIKLTVSHGEETRVSVSGHPSRQVSVDMSQEYAELVAQDNVFNESMPPDEGPPPQCRTLHLERGPEGLGFSIVGGHGSPHGDLPIYVKNVFAKGAAADEGNLKRGDQIISVNGRSLEGCTHDEAVTVLKNAKGTVTMTVLTS